MNTPIFKDMDDIVLQYGDVVVIIVGGLPIGKLVKGEVVDIGTDYIEIRTLDSKESYWVYKPEQVLLVHRDDIVW